MRVAVVVGLGRKPPFSFSTSVPFHRFLSSSNSTCINPIGFPTYYSLLTTRPTTSPSPYPRLFSANIPAISACFPPSIRVRVAAMSSGAADGTGNGMLDFPLSPNCCLKIHKGDITHWSVDGTSDAIVNAANERMLGGGGVDGAIHRAAGPELKEACAKVPEVRPGVRCPTGEARITPGFRLPASHVIHTVGPIYDVDKNPEESLRSAYRNSLRVAKEHNIQYIAFPAISCGVYRFPYDEAAKIAISTVKEFANDFKEVHFVLFSDDIYDVWVEKAKEIVGKE